MPKVTRQSRQLTTVLVSLGDDKGQLVMPKDYVRLINKSGWRPTS